MKRKGLKKAFNKITFWVMKAVPVILPMVMLVHANSTTCVINGQPEPPASLRKYRKF